MNLVWTTSRGDFDGTRSWLSAKLDDGYSLKIALQENDDGVLICTELQLSFEGKKTPDVPINSRYLQLLGLGEILSSARAEYLELLDITAEANIFLEAQQDIKHWPNPGALGHADKKYAQLAFLYTNLVRSGCPNPIDELAQDMDCDRETASSRVAESRNRGLLTRPKQGHLGGRLTSKAEKLLEMKKGKK